MKNMKKNLISLLILMLMFSLIGCSSISEKNTTTVLASKVESKQNVTKGNLKVHFINVGQADSILIEQGSSSMLIDAGNNEDANTVKNYIAEQGITKLDYIVGTHPHEDHIGGMDYVINSFEVGKIYMPRATSNTKTFEDVVSAIKAKGMKATVPKVLETFKVGDATATILAPSSGDYKDINNTSIVIRLTFGNNSFMFDGDAEDISEKEIISKKFDISADVLKVGHHGSNSSSSQEFLDKVNPKYAVISVGIGNSYGHPHKTTMEKLKEKNIKVYRTDENGTIIATSDGKNITFNTKVGSYNFAGTGSGVSSDSVPSTNKSSSANTSISPQPITVPKVSNISKTVYYTPKGKSYHYDKSCSTLSRSNTILTGTLGDALSSSHNDPCNVCAGGK
ncbi:ComEC/Rec2 family competence protein [Clostridium lacusfryxellense]|uniref:ComEC/Rec2 family competence protein n=1 Tax=Clostridium lacusfryxellense TaxID=205328 RepID=UPI001C0BA6E9|nr:ComEC/Rec2 family competence protein [Clostridium lacusfryxellense]MBU3112359.1 MBL fold metallo-hydrolase [Clostridium lacusfryxellense]